MINTYCDILLLKCGICGILRSTERAVRNHDISESEHIYAIIFGSVRVAGVGSSRKPGNVKERLNIRK